MGYHTPQGHPESLRFGAEVLKATQRAHRGLEGEVQHAGGSEHVGQHGAEPDEKFTGLTDEEVAYWMRFFSEEG